MAFELKLAQYSGPLEKLLELIEEKKLEITEISLASVTDDFLRYLSELKAVKLAEAGEELSDPDLRTLADFIVIASRLIFIKSKSLLPDLTLTAEEETDIRDLEKRLKFYQELRPAMKVLARLWRRGSTELSRPYFLNLAHWIIPRPPQDKSYQLAHPEEGKEIKFFYPGRNVNVINIQNSLNKIFDGLEVYIKETQVIREKIVSLEEKINEVVARVREIQETSFKKLSESKSKSEVIVTFLAVLHLAREQLVLIEQAGHLSDIIIKHKTAT